MNRLLKLIIKNKEIHNILMLAWPVLIAQASQTAITFVDTLMVGHYHTTDLAGVSLGNSIFLPLILFGYGILSILSPMTAHLNGAARRDLIKNQTRQGFILALLVSIFIMIILYNGGKIIRFMSGKNEIDLEMYHIAVDYLRIIMWGVPGYLFYVVCRCQCEGLSNTKPAMFIAFLALIINVPINYTFIYGKFGFPELGGRGSGLAAATVYILMFIFMYAFIKKTPKQRDIVSTTLTTWLDHKTLLKIFTLGLPLALALLFESSLFAIVPLFIAPLGVQVVSAQQIVSIISSMTFVIPLSLAVATSIRVGYLLGAQKPLEAKNTAYTSLCISFLISLVVASILWHFGPYFIAGFTSQPDVLKLGSSLITLLALYQCSDYLQVVAASVLRGHKDTKSIFFITFISYWLVGLPTGYILGMTDFILPHKGPAGFWIGFIFGLSVAAVLLLSRMNYLQKKELSALAR